MNTKLYVGNLSYNVTEKQLREFFAKSDTVVTADVIIDRTTSRSKGFGFVEMETAAGAKKAITELDGKDFEGRNIIVNEARPRKTRDYPERRY